MQHTADETSAFLYKHPHPAVTVDLAIFSVIEATLKILLIERGRAPFQGQLALPGGFVRIHEDLEDAARRELQEETNLSQTYLEQVGAFGKTERDPRERVISVAFFSVISADKVALQAGSDARAVGWYAAYDLPTLAFDHSDIIDRARAKLIEKMGTSTLALEFLPAQFTLGELQQVFEVVRGEPVDKRNFRKWAETFSFIKPTGKMRRGGQHRPAALYKATARGPFPTSASRAAQPSDGDVQRQAGMSSAYTRGYEDALAAMHKALIDSEQHLLRNLVAR